MMTQRASDTRQIVGKGKEDDISNTPTKQRCFYCRFLTPTFEIDSKGFFNEVGKVEIRDSNLSRLKLPPGFRINIFAELQNPRMIAVADDGTIYVSQREPGTLTMLKDTDGDGIADIQKIVGSESLLVIRLIFTTQASVQLIVHDHC